MTTQERDEFGEDGARPSSLVPVHKPSVRDPLHDLQWLRDVKIINERTLRELGPLPAGGLPVRTKRKPKMRSPNPHQMMRAAPNSATESQENEGMKVTHAAAATVLATAATLTACGGDGHASSVMDVNKPALAGGVTSASGEHRGSITAVSPILMKPMTYSELAKALSLNCEDADKGRGCTMRNANSEDRFTVTLHPGCGKEGIFVVVNNAEDGAELWGTPPGVEMRATLSKGQVVCIQATAYIEGEITPFYYYVTTVPLEMLEDCRGAAACEKYADPPITSHVPHPGPVCRTTGPWSDEGVCAAGWIRAENIAGFFNRKPTTDNGRTESDQ